MTLSRHPSLTGQNGIASGTSVGEIIGLQIAGYFADKVGYRWTIIPALAAMVAFIFIPFFAESLTVLLVGEILQGVSLVVATIQELTPGSWSVFQTMTIAYASEIAPTAIRHWLTSFVNLEWFIGGFLSGGVLRGFVNSTTVWG